jgi:nicotinate phosphoribosyltransferase
MIHSFHTGLWTDLYQLTMAQGYFLSGRHEERATFDYFFRKNPFKGGYVVFSGLEEAVKLLLHPQPFDRESCEYLLEQGFHKEFVNYLSEFRFTGNLISAQEGEIVFPNAPMLSVDGSLLECQWAETLLLNRLNFNSLIATKASRIRSVAGDKTLMEFGLRRSQGWAGLDASRSAYIGGFDSTSNVHAGKTYGIPISGTQAHSWIQSFPSEKQAFQTFIDHFPDRSILLVDTYDTLRSGVPNAIEMADKLKDRGQKLHGIRLDSGDLAYLSRKARNMLDKSGHTDVKIYASNQLSEYLIRSLNHQEAKIDGYGVGTELVTGQSDAALDGVYKLASVDGRPSLKISENIEKITLPGRKEVYRFFHKTGDFRMDGVLLYNEDSVSMLYHPIHPSMNTSVEKCTHQPLRHVQIKDGKRVSEPRTLKDIKTYAAERLHLLPKEYRRFENPHIYKVGVSQQIFTLKQELLDKNKL